MRNVVRNENLDLQATDKTAQQTEITVNEVEDNFSNA